MISVNTAFSIYQAFEESKFFKTLRIDVINFGENLWLLGPNSLIFGVTIDESFSQILYEINSSTQSIQHFTTESNFMVNILPKQTNQKLKA